MGPDHSFDNVISVHFIFPVNIVSNAFYSENKYFSQRIDALRHHDRRRAMLRDNRDQPDQLYDFDNPCASAVRKRYLDSDTPVQCDDTQESESGRTRRDDPSVPTLGNEGVELNATIASDVDNPSLAPIGGAQGGANAGATVLRPLRLLPIGTAASVTAEDKAFLKYAAASSLPISYLQPCPKTRKSDSRSRYLKYMHADRLSTAIELGATMKDVLWDYSRGYIQFPSHESTLPGHVFRALAEPSELDPLHVLSDSAIAGDLVLDLSARKSAFNNALRSALPSTPLLPQFLSRSESDKWAAHEFEMAMNATSLDIDFSLPSEPQHYKDSLPDVCSEAEHWSEARDEEMKSMKRFGVYKRVPKSAARGKQILGVKWVFKRKTNKSGKVTRYRARLVAQGFRQREWDSFNPDDIHSPVVHKDSLRMLLSIAAAENLHVHQADVKAAFLQAPLKEKIYIRAPPGYASRTADGEEEVLELSQAIYGLKQSSACFYEAVREHLLALGFTTVVGDPCVFKRVSPDGGVILACTYVDDITFAVSDPALVDTFMADLRQRFVIDDGEGGPIDYLLGIAVDQNLDAGTIHLDMELAITKLCHSILSVEELARAGSIKSPMLVTPLKTQDERTVPKEAFDYLSVVGSLLHVANCVRPDISYAVGNLARFAVAPGKPHVRAAKRVLLYLFNTRGLGITYRRTSPSGKNEPLCYEKGKHPLDDGTNQQQVFVDSDYAADESRRSTMGCVVMMNSGPISWFSALSKSVALSTCEAEIHAAVAAAKDAVHTARLLSDLGYSNGSEPIQIAEDNASAIVQAESGLRQVRNAKHYEVRLAFLQQLVLAKEVSFRYCPTDFQLADLFTKPLPEEKHLGFVRSIMAPR